MTEAEAILARAEAYLNSDECARHIDYTREVLAAQNSFEAYWAGSATASVLRDYRARRAVEVSA